MRSDTPVRFAPVLAALLASLTLALLALSGCAAGPVAEGLGYEIMAAGRPLAEGDELPTLGEGATLNDYLAYAAMNNPGLRAAFHRWRAAAHEIPQARSLPDPRLSFGYFIREVETRRGPQRWKLGLSQPFPAPGVLSLRGKAARASARAAGRRLEAARLALRRRVVDAYVEYGYLHRDTEITAENVELVRYLEQVARTRYRAAAAGHPDVIRAQVELARLEDRLRALTGLRAAASARLSAALGRPRKLGGDPLPWPGPAARDEIVADPDATLKLAAANNPELEAMSFEIDRERAGVALARKAYVPSFALGVDYVKTDRSDMDVDDNGDDAVMAMLSISLPIWRGGLRARQRQAAEMLAAARASREEAARQLESIVGMALFRLEDSRSKISLYRDTLLPKAEQSLRATDAAFRAGKSDFLDLITDQRTLLEFKLSLERSRRDHAMAAARLETLTGGTIPRKVESPSAEKDGN